MSAPDAARYSFSARKLTQQIKANQRTEPTWVGMYRTIPRCLSGKLEGLKQVVPPPKKKMRNINRSQP